MADISIIVPVYNTGRTIESCLDSLLNQTLKDIEIICVDDGSTDTSTIKLLLYQQRDKRIRVLRQENCGTGAARNAGLRAAHGTFIMFCDSDDVFELDMCEKMRDTIIRENADLVKCCYKTPRGVRVMDEGAFAAQVENPVTMSPSDTWVGLLGMEVWDKIFRRSIIDAHNVMFPPTRYAEDTAFNLQYAAVSNTAFFLTDCLYTYFVYKDSLCRQEASTGKYKNDVVASYRYVIDFLINKNMFKQNMFKQNSALLEFLYDELRMLSKTLKGDAAFFAKIKEKILCFYDEEQLTPYPALHAIKSGNQKLLQDALESIAFETAMGFKAPPGVMFVYVKQ